MLESHQAKCLQRAPESLSYSLSRMIVSAGASHVASSSESRCRGTAQGPRSGDPLRTCFRAAKLIFTKKTNLIKSPKIRQLWNSEVNNVIRDRLLF